MRVLMISASFFPQIDGAVRVVYDLCGKLSQRELEVYLLTRWFPGSRSLGDFDGIRVIRVGPSKTSTLNRVLLQLNQTIKLIKILREQEFDVIHCHGCVPALVGLVGKVMRRVPLIITFHGHQVLWPGDVRWKGNIVVKLQLLLEKIILKNADVVIAQSSGVKNFLISSYGSQVGQKVEIIPNGVDLNKFDVVHKEEAFQKSSVILSIGVLERRKGLDVLVRAIPRVLTRFPRTKFIIVGGGPLRSNLQNLAEELGVRDSVIFTGRISDEKLNWNYRRADIVTLTSYEGFFGLVLPEAMAMCKPVISTKAMGPSHIVVDDESGILVEPGNPMQLAYTIKRLLSNQKLARRIGFKGRKIVERNMTSTRLFSNMKNFMKQSHVNHRNARYLNV